MQHSTSLERAATRWERTKGFCAVTYPSQPLEDMNLRAGVPNITLMALSSACVYAASLLDPYMCRMCKAYFSAYQYMFTGEGRAARCRTAQ